jgi:formamidopyrimidine-DNA glycosylase
MPEGVEIYIQINKLKPKCLGKTIVEINRNNRFQKNGIKNPEMVALPLKVIDVWSRGKVIIFETVDRNNEILYITSQLGMSGQWVFEPHEHSNLWISFGEPSPTHPGYWQVNETIWYDDMKHFGSIGFYRDLTEIWKRHGPCLMLTTLINNGEIDIKHLKPDQKLVSLELYSKEIKNKRFKSKRIAEFMMDQTRVAGVGNYLRAEILYQARISPERLLTSLSDSDIKTLYESTLDVMYRSYIAKGKYHVGQECGSGFKMLAYKQLYDPNGYRVVTFPDKNDRMCYYVPEIQL